MPERWWELLFWLDILLFLILGPQDYPASPNWLDGLAGKKWIVIAFFFSWIIYRWKISVLLDLTQKALKCFLQPDTMLFSVFHLASKKNYFSQIWIKFFFFLLFFFFSFRECNNYLHRPTSDSNHMSGLQSNEPCSPTSGNCPLATMASLSAPNGRRCHGALCMPSALSSFHTLPHLPPLSSRSHCSQAFGKLCGAGDIWKPKVLKNSDAETGQKLKKQGDWVSLAIWIPISLEPLQSLLASPRKSCDTETHPQQRTKKPACWPGWDCSRRTDTTWEIELGWKLLFVIRCSLSSIFFIFLLRKAELCFIKTS